AYHDKFENTLYMYPKKGNTPDYSHYDDYSTGAALQLGIDTRETDTGADDNIQTAFNWEMMAKYSLAHNDNIRFSISDRSRFPTQNERYTTEKPKDGSKGIINPDLDPERALSFDLTYEGHITDKWGY
ncbi:TonB-dependent receptor, partial [Proteus terrae]|uniref:TonB-dependent receptor domain-containing protein n=1 Tax=Proteus terrae TaxID=1574161 RepID=UPI0033154E98